MKRVGDSSPAGGSGQPEDPVISFTKFWNDNASNSNEEVANALYKRLNLKSAKPASPRILEKKDIAHHFFKDGAFDDNCIKVALKGSDGFKKFIRGHLSDFIYLVVCHRNVSEKFPVNALMTELLQGDNLARFVAYIRNQAPSYVACPKPATSLIVKPANSLTALTRSELRCLALDPGYSPGNLLPEDKVRLIDALDLRKRFLRTDHFSSEQYINELIEVFLRFRATRGADEHLYELFKLNQNQDDQLIMRTKAKICVDMVRALAKDDFDLEKFISTFKIGKMTLQPLLDRLQRTILHLALAYSEIDIDNFAENFVALHQHLKNKNLLS